MSFRARQLTELYKKCHLKIVFNPVITVLSNILKLFESRRECIPCIREQYIRQLF